MYVGRYVTWHVQGVAPAKKKPTILHNETKTISHEEFRRSGFVLLVCESMTPPAPFYFIPPASLSPLHPFFLFLLFLVSLVVVRAAAATKTWGCSLSLLSVSVQSVLSGNTNARGDDLKRVRVGPSIHACSADGQTGTNLSQQDRRKGGCALYRCEHGR